MTLKTQIAADVTAVFFNTDEFALPARVWDGNTSVATEVIDAADETLNGPVSWPMGEAQGKTFLLQRADVPTPRKGVEIEIISTGEYWMIQEHRPSSDNVWSAYCVRSQRVRA